MKKNPKISIITVCYNSAKHLEQCIKSVLDQDYPNLEYLVIDGGSTDGTIDIISKYRDKIAYFGSESDNGISDAFNKGIKAATGDIIGIINSDDFMMPNALQKISEYYEDDIDVYRGYCLIWDEKLDSKRKLYPNERFSVPPFGAIICHESSFISRKRYEKLGGYKVDFKYAMDLDLFVRMYRDSLLKSRIVDVCVITFRTGGASSSAAAKIESERKRLVLENGGNLFAANLFVFYHRVKYAIKVMVNIIREWIKK